MSAAEAAISEPARPAPGIGRAVVPLLALAVFINYVDRGNLATAAPQIKDQLKLSATEIGFVISAFFWTYTPGQLLSGWVAERINPYRTLAIGLAIWALATAALGLTTGLVGLIALRLVLGVGESAAFPCSSKLFAQHLSADRLGIANGMVGLGLSLGPAFGTLAGGMLMARFGWRASFLVFGLTSLLWLWPWRAVTKAASARADAAPRVKAPSYLAILAQPDMWGAALGHFSANYGFYFLISFLPLYLVKARGFSMQHMAEMGAMIYVVYAVSAQGAGWAADRWMRAGADANRVRKTLAVACHLSYAAALLACAFGDATGSIVCLFLGVIGSGLNTAGIFAIGQTLAGPVAAGKWIGVQNSVGNLAGVVAPIVTGAVVDRTGHFFWAFVVAAAVTALGAIGWGLMIRRVAPVSWAAA